MKFDTLARFLRKNGYTVKTKTENVSLSRKKEIIKSATITGKSIRGGFCFTKATETSMVYPYIKNLISFDNIKCFDKWSKCPIQSLTFPENEEQQKLLLKAMKFITSKRGYDKSNQYEIWGISTYEAIEKLLKEEGLWKK